MAAKQLKFTYGDKDYTLEFNRKSIEIMEKNGFVASEITEKPMTVLPALFSGAFFMHHPFVKRAVIDEIYAKLTDKQELIGKLVEMFNEPIRLLMDDPEESEGNVNWEANW